MTIVMVCITLGLWAIVPAQAHQPSGGKDTTFATDEVARHGPCDRHEAQDHLAACCGPLCIPALPPVATPAVAKGHVTPPTIRAERLVVVALPQGLWRPPRTGTPV